MVGCVGIHYTLLVRTLRSRSFVPERSAFKGIPSFRTKRDEAVLLRHAHRFFVGHWIENRGSEGGKEDGKGGWALFKACVGGRERRRN